MWRNSSLSLCMSNEASLFCWHSVPPFLAYLLLRLCSTILDWFSQTFRRLNPWLFREDIDRLEKITRSKSQLNTWVNVTNGTNSQFGKGSLTLWPRRILGDARGGIWAQPGQIGDTFLVIYGTCGFVSLNTLSSEVTLNRSTFWQVIRRWPFVSDKSRRRRGNAAEIPANGVTRNTSTHCKCIVYSVCRIVYSRSLSSESLADHVQHQNSIVIAPAKVSSEQSTMVNVKEKVCLICIGKWAGFHKID